MAIQKYRYEAGDTDGWLKIRKSLKDRIGGSELGQIAGHQPHCSAFKSFCQRCGAIKPAVLKKLEAIIQGHDGEQGVADRFEREMNKRVHKENSIMVNDKYAHLKASVDRIIYGEHSGLECKTAKDMAMKKYKHGDFPMSYFDQCLLYLAVTEYDNWYLAIQVFGTAFRMFLMTRDKKLADRYHELKAKFVEWEMFKAENYNEWTYDHAQKKFIWEGDLDEGQEMPGLPIPVGIVDFDDPDLTEWEDNRWGKLEAVYYVDEEEIQACEDIAAMFIDRVHKVEAYMADKKFNNEDERKAAIVNAIRQVWPAEELDDSESTADTVVAITDDVVVNSVETYDELSPVFALIEQRADLNAQKKTVEDLLQQVESKIELSLGNVETAKTTKWKVTYKMSSSREYGSVAAIKQYFTGKGLPIPEGMITTSEPKRSLRFYAVKEPGTAKRAKK